MRRAWDRWRHAQTSRLRFFAIFEPGTRLVPSGRESTQQRRGDGFFAGGGF